MSQETIRTIYHNGIFIPQSPCALNNNSEVKLVIQSSNRQNVDIIDSEARQQILNTLLRRMRQTSISAYTRH